MIGSIRPTWSLIVIKHFFKSIFSELDHNFDYVAQQFIYFNNL